MFTWFPCEEHMSLEVLCQFGHKFWLMLKLAKKNLHIFLSSLYSFCSLREWQTPVGKLFVFVAYSLWRKPDWSYMCPIALCFYWGSFFHNLSKWKRLLLGSLIYSTQCISHFSKNMKLRIQIMNNRMCDWYIVCYDMI